MTNWEELQQEILELIACRLAIEDFLAFGGVCTSWQSAAAKETYKARSKALWLTTHADIGIAEFSSLSIGRIYPVWLPGSLAETLSAIGWILVSKGGSEYRIFNPLLCVSIDLPTLEKLDLESHLSAELDRLERLWCGPRGINMMAISSSPSLSKTYTVMISYAGSSGFAFHRSREDAWTEVKPVMHLRWCIVLQLIYYDGLFVALDTQCQIMTLNEQKLRMESRLVLELSNVEGELYLIECSGSLLVAWTIVGKDGAVEKIQVFEVDLEKVTKEEVKSLGNASLFLNGNSSSFLVEFNAESCLLGIKPNHVYFPDDQGDKMKSYNMEDGKVETYFDSPRRHINETEWFQPNF